MATSRHAVMIMAHTDWIGLRHLVELLDHNRVDIFIHINAGSKDWDDKILDGVCKLSKVIFAPRESVTYCNYSQVRAIVSLLKTATTTDTYARYHIISGADLPIKPIDYILSYFDSNPNSEFVGFSNNYDTTRAGLYFPFNDAIRTSKGLLCKLLIKAQKYIVKAQRSLGVNIAEGYNGRPLKGFDWWSITHDAAIAVLAGEPKFRCYFQHTYCPSELLVQTILGNDPRFADRFYDKDNEVKGSMRLIDWKRGTPYVWRTDDFEEIVVSQCMWARKFDSNIDKNIISKIITHIKKDE